jgi:hypothetical protein
MPKWITAIFVFFLSTTLLTAKAITVEDVIRKHVEVMASEGHNEHRDNEHRDKEIFADYFRNGYKPKLEGIEKVDGRPCYKISFDLTTGNNIYYLIDAKTWYVIRRSASVAGKPLAIKAVDDKEGKAILDSKQISEPVIEAGNN